MPRSFDDLVEEASTVSVDGWDFSWLDGRATEARPPWGYARLMSQRWSDAEAALDVQTGGGEVLAEIERVPPIAVATEGWQPNLDKAAALLAPRGVTVVADDDRPSLPFAAASFDLVTSRHPVQVWWDDIARVLRPGGLYCSQQVGPASVFELVEYMLGPLPADVRRRRHPDDARTAAINAGLEVVTLQTASLRTEFFDVGAVIYFLRKVIWMVPGFTVEQYLPTLRRLHDDISRHGPFVATTTRFLIEARRPG